MDAEKLITLLKKVLLKEADSQEQEELNRILSEDESLAGISAEFISEQQSEDHLEETKTAFDRHLSRMKKQNLYPGGTA